MKKLKKNCFNCECMEWAEGDVGDPAGFICVKKDINDNKIEDKMIKNMEDDIYKEKAKKCFEPSKRAENLLKEENEKNIFFKIILGISKEQNLDLDLLCKILLIKKEDVLDCKNTKRASYSSESQEDPNDYYANKKIKKQKILDFVNLYNCLSSFYIDLNAVEKWLKTPHSKFDNISPLELMEKDKDGVSQAFSHIQNVMNGP